MRLISLMLVAAVLALSACATMPSDPAERALAFAQQCVGDNTSLADLDDQQNRPGMCGFEVCIPDGVQPAIQRMLRTASGEVFKAGYANGDLFIMNTVAKTPSCTTDPRPELGTPQDSLSGIWDTTIVVFHPDSDSLR